MARSESNNTNTIGEEEIQVGDLSYKRLSLLSIRKTDFTQNDRIVISTQSGNRYMIRWSKSVNQPKIYSERDGFQQGYPLIDKYADNQPIAEVGSPFHFTFQMSEQTAQKFEATTVTSIEVTKDVEADIVSGALQRQSSATRNPMQLLMDHVTGRVSESNL